MNTMTQAAKRQCWRGPILREAHRRQLIWFSLYEPRERVSSAVYTARHVCRASSAPASGRWCAVRGGLGRPRGPSKDVAAEPRVGQRPPPATLLPGYPTHSARKLGWRNGALPRCLLRALFAASTRVWVHFIRFGGARVRSPPGRAEAKRAARAKAARRRAARGAYSIGQAEPGSPGRARPGLVCNARRLLAHMPVASRRRRRRAARTWCGIVSHRGVVTPPRRSARSARSRRRRRRRRGSARAALREPPCRRHDVAVRRTDFPFEKARSFVRGIRDDATGVAVAPYARFCPVRVRLGFVLRTAAPLQSGQEDDRHHDPSVRSPSHCSAWPGWAGPWRCPLARPKVPLGVVFDNCHVLLTDCG